MALIKIFTRGNLENLQAEVEEVLKKLGDKHGVAFEVKPGSFSSTNATFKLGINTKNQDGTVTTPEKRDWDAYHIMFGFEKDDFGREFRHGGHTFKIDGLHPSRPKYPVTGSRVPDGKRFKFPAESVLATLRRDNVMAGVPD